MKFFENIESLNKEFAREENIVFEEGPGGLPFARIGNAHCATLISVYAGHIISYIPHGCQDILWMSKNSFFDFGKPVRGGIPVCWPWFGAYPDGGEDKPPHGFARKMMWQVKDTGILEDGSSRLLLELEASGETLGMWNHDFRLNIEFIAGSSMKVALRTENTGISPFEITQALHSYFSVGDISQIEIEGFADSEYIDALKPDGWNRGRVSGSVVFDKETDLIFPDNGNSYTIRDFSMKRKIHISKSGSNSAVVWNPWIDKSARMPDFGDNEYRDMVCVEVTNTSADKRIISPGEKHTLSTELSCETL